MKTTTLKCNWEQNHDAIKPEDDNYFLTDAISDEAVRQLREHDENGSETPFFQYVAYTAPHWPLHAHEADIAKYKGRFDAGWDKLREARLERMIEMGILNENAKLSERDPDVGPWDEQPHKEWETRRMEVYAAQIDRMDLETPRISSPAMKAPNQLR